MEAATAAGGPPRRPAVLILHALLYTSLLLNALLLARHFVSPTRLGAASDDDGGCSCGLTWSLKAAREAEAVAATDCSGHGQVFLDGVAGEDGRTGCECNKCFGGADCSMRTANCTADADSAAVIKKLGFWGLHALPNPNPKFWFGTKIKIELGWGYLNPCSGVAKRCARTMAPSSAAGKAHGISTPCVPVTRIRTTPRGISSAAREPTRARLLAVVAPGCGRDTSASPPSHRDASAPPLSRLRSSPPSPRIRSGARAVNGAFPPRSPTRSPRHRRARVPRRRKDRPARHKLRRAGPHAHRGRRPPLSPCSPTWHRSISSLRGATRQLEDQPARHQIVMALPPPSPGHRRRPSARDGARHSGHHGEQLDGAPRDFSHARVGEQLPRHHGGAAARPGSPPCGRRRGAEQERVREWGESALGFCPHSPVLIEWREPSTVRSEQTSQIPAGRERAARLGRIAGLLACAQG
ncbi:hypothetical protein EJB05_17188, partial [Eragrostis curvula]